MGSAPLQAALWGAKAKDWADLHEPKHRPLWQAMLDAIGFAAGTRLLDAGPIQAALRSVPETRIHEALMRIIAPFRSADGSIRLNNRFRFVLAAP